MITGVITVLHRSIFAGCAALLLYLLIPDTGSAQQYVGNAKRKCAGNLTVTAPGMSAQVRPFETRSADVTSSTLSWQCDGQPQQEINCPANTNRILIDRSQGGNFFSIICLRK
jgi:hypothetical protein